MGEEVDEQVDKFVVDSCQAPGASLGFLQPEGIKPNGSDESSSIELMVMIRCVGVGGEDRQRGSQGEKMRGSGMIMETE